MIRFLFECFLWGVGFQPRGAATSSGFGSEHLIPTRERTSLEAVIRALSSILFLLAILSQFVPTELSFLTSPELHLLASGGAAWALLMIFRPSVPMDSTAISTGLWSFAGYLPFFLLGNLFDLPLASLLGQAGLVTAVMAYGLYRDIRREIHAERP